MLKKGKKYFIEETWGAAFPPIFVWKHCEKPGLGTRAMTKYCFLIEINAITRVTLSFFISMLNQSSALITQINDASFVPRGINRTYLATLWKQERITVKLLNKQKKYFTGKTPNDTLYSFNLMLQAPLRIICKSLGIKLQDYVSLQKHSGPILIFYVI